MKILLLQLDGKLPNLALMRIASWHGSRGDTVELRQIRRAENVERNFFDCEPDGIYASLIFEKSRPLARRVKQLYPNAVIGGTGWEVGKTLESVGIDNSETNYDWSIYPNYRQSIGFTQRGCRLNCWFCVVPEKEGKVREVATIADIWRGEPWPREILLLDNDFFGQANWRARIDELRSGKFKVSFNQGINARMLSDEAASAIASVNYQNDSMKGKGVYTAWDNIGDEKPLFRGLSALVKYGVSPDDITVYMLVGTGESEEDRLYRHDQLRSFGCRPYPMPYRRTSELIGFQRWCLRAADKKISWQEYKRHKCRSENFRAVDRVSLFMVDGIS